jgi:hypothetical protein
MMAPEERIDARVHPAVKALVAGEAEARDCSLNDVVNEKIALAYGLDPKEYPVPRKRMGRRLRSRKEKT